MLGLAGLWSRPASAGNLEIAPVQIELSAGVTNTLISLRNSGPVPMRYQVSLFSWRQDERGEMKLEPTRDVIFFPAMLSLAPGEQRSLRVGSAVPFTDREQTYRLIVEELPPMARETETGQVHILTRLSLPVFLEPATRKAQAELAGLKLEAGRFSFRLRSAGNVRIRPQAARAVAHGAKGEVLHEQQLDTWYVLAGDGRSLDAEIPKDLCSKVRSLSAEVTLEKGELRAELPTPSGACAP